MNEIGINMEKVKLNNCSAILQLLNRKGPMSKKDLAFELGLTSSAVTILCRDMMNQNIIVNKGEMVEDRRTGRRKVLIDINYQSKTIVSISIQPVFTYLYLCDMNGNPISYHKIKTDTQIKPNDFLHEIANQVESLMIKENIDWNHIMGVGVTIPGIVDTQKGVSIQSNGLWNEKIYIKDRLEERLNVHVTVDNQTKALAKAELIYGTQRDNDRILYIKWGQNIESSMAFQNSHYEKEYYNIGELAHYIIDPRGEKCRCGKYGCLETIVSYERIIKKINEHFSKEKTPDLYQKLNGSMESMYREVTENNQLDKIIHVKDIPVINIIKYSIQIIAISIINAVTVLIPNQVVVLSPFFDKVDYYQYLIECCQNIEEGFDKETIVTSRLKHAMNYIGGVAISANHDFFHCGGLRNEYKDYSRL